MVATELLDSHKTEVVELCRKYDVTRLRLFGSSLTDRWDETRSDLDFLVEYGPGIYHLPPLDRLVGLKLALEELFAREVDVVDWVVVRNPFFRENAERGALEIYVAWKSYRKGYNHDTN